jgi:hypothetical protein
MLVVEPSITEARYFHDQRYVEAGRFERRRRDGTLATIITWVSDCPVCGEPFTTTTPAASTKFQPNRRCQKHKRPGQRVRQA